MTLSVSRFNSGLPRTGAIVAVRPTLGTSQRQRPSEPDTGKSNPPANTLPVPVRTRGQSHTGYTAFPGRPPATLIAHLIATRMGVPQTRNRRCASPGDADTAYRQADRLGPESTVSRKLSI